MNITDQEEDENEEEISEIPELIQKLFNIFYYYILRSF